MYEQNVDPYYLDLHSFFKKTLSIFLLDACLGQVYVIDLCRRQKYLNIVLVLQDE